MSDTPLNAITQVKLVLEIYDVPERRILAYADFYSRDLKTLSRCDTQELAMILAFYEGGCDNPPPYCPQIASAAAWGYTNINSLPSLTAKEFTEGVNELMKTANSSPADGTILNRETVATLARGFYFLSEGLEAGETDMEFAKTFEEASSLLDTLMERADLGYSESAEGTVLVEDSVSDWLMDNIQCVIDYATVLLTYETLNVKTVEDLESGIETLKSAYIEFMHEVN